MSTPFCPYENAVWEIVHCQPELVPYGLTAEDVWAGGGSLLAAGNCGGFVYLYGRLLGVLVRQAAEYFASPEWLAAMRLAVVKGYSLQDTQGSIKRISCEMPAGFRWE